MKIVDRRHHIGKQAALFVLNFSILFVFSCQIATRKMNAKVKVKTNRRPCRIEDMISLIVENVPFRTTELELRRAFEHCGALGDVFIPRNPRTGDSKGYGFVRFYNLKDAQLAIERMHGRLLDGKVLTVGRAKGKWGGTTGTNSLQEGPRVLLPPKPGMNRRSASIYSSSSSDVSSTSQSRPRHRSRRSRSRSVHDTRSDDNEAMPMPGEQATKANNGETRSRSKPRRPIGANAWKCGHNTRCRPPPPPQAKDDDKDKEDSKDKKPGGNNGSTNTVEVTTTTIIKIYNICPRCANETNVN